MANETTPRTMRNTAISPVNIKGVYTALITPMLPGDGLTNKIDYRKLYRLINDQAHAGVSGIVVAGTSGQSSTLSLEEHIELAINTFSYIRTYYPNLQFIAGAGSNSTREAIYLASGIEEAIGPTTFLHATGYYNNPNQAGLVEHFERLANCLPKSNIILYNIPKRTGSNIKFETIMQLLHVKNIVGIKVAVGGDTISDSRRIAYYSNLERPDGFVVLSGEDNVTVPVIQNGGRGVISAAANIAPRYFARMTELALSGNFEEAYRMHRRIYPFLEHVVYADVNPIPLAHLFDTEVRLPLKKSDHLEFCLRYRLGEGNREEYNISPEELGIDLNDYGNARK